MPGEGRDGGRRRSWESLVGGGPLSGPLQPGACWLPLALNLRTSLPALTLGTLTTDRRPPGRDCLVRAPWASGGESVGGPGSVPPPRPQCPSGTSRRSMGRRCLPMIRSQSGTALVMPQRIVRGRPPDAVPAEGGGPPRDSPMRATPPPRGPWCTSARPGVSPASLRRLLLGPVRRVRLTREETLGTLWREPSPEWKLPWST
jgi:hypothetical protein